MSLNHFKVRYGLGCVEFIPFDDDKEEETIQAYTRAFLLARSMKTTPVTNVLLSVYSKPKYITDQVHVIGEWDPRDLKVDGRMLRKTNRTKPQPETTT